MASTLSSSVGKPRMSTENPTDLRTAEREAAALLKGDFPAADLSARLFGPQGIFTQAGTTQKRREALVKRPVYREAQARIAELQRQEAARFEKDIGRSGTLGNLARSALCGIWADRAGTRDSVQFARRLRRQAESRGRG